MTVIATLVLNAVLLIGLFFSIYVATAWGEMAGHLPGGDKSGLGGFAMVFILMGIRWLALAAVLAAGVMRGGFEALIDGGRGRQSLVVLGAHVLLGIGSAWLFNTLANGLTADRAAPRAATVLGAVVLPLPALLAGAYAIQRDWVTRHGRLATLLAVAIIALHAFLYRDRLRDMERARAPRPPAEAGAS